MSVSWNLELLLLMGVIGLFSPLSFVDGPGAAVFALFVGGVIITLAVFTTQGAKNALLTVFVIISLDTVVLVFSIIQSRQNLPLLLSIFLRLSFIQSLAQGLEGFNYFSGQSAQ